MADSKDTIRKATALFRQHGGVLRTAEAIRLGIHPRTIYEMRNSGLIEQIGWGLYRLSSLPPLSSPDLASASLQVPGGVICLISALAFHDITTQVPHEVYMALPRGAKRPRIDYPPVRIFWLSGKAFSEGIETRMVDDIQIRVYSPEKTIADCFKYRNKIGLDVAVEALKLHLQHKKKDINKVVYYSRICRVEKVILPYIEAII